MVYITQQIHSPPQQNLVARLIANLLILNPCPQTDENYEGRFIF